MGGDHVPAGQNYDRTQEEVLEGLTGWEGQKLLVDFPEGTSYLEKARWYNWVDKPTPPLFTSPAENRRIWQEMDVERMLDHHPVHDIYPGDLPDYHYWGPIHNEIENRLPKDRMSLIDSDYHRDMTNIPRFFVTGMPKTPPHEQVWYVPLGADGRFDWRKNIELNGYSASFMSVEGWKNQRFFKRHHQGFFANSTKGRWHQWKERMVFKSQEVPGQVRGIRFFRNINTHYIAWWSALYCGLFGILGANGSHYREYNWYDDIWNYDIWILKNMYREKGAFHGAV